MREVRPYSLLKHPRLLTETTTTKISVNTLTISHTSLTNVMLSNLKRAEVIEVSFNPLLVNLALPQLETATTVRIVNQTVISMLDIGNLRHVETLEIVRLRSGQKVMERSGAAGTP